jgi:hypothetical protein
MSEESPDAVRSALGVETARPAVGADAARPMPVGPITYVRPLLTRPEKYEKLAFTFCRLGTTGLIAWVLGPPLFVLIVAVVAIALYLKSISLGVSWTKCLLRKPSLVVAFWGVVAAADAFWLFVLGGRALI